MMLAGQDFIADGAYVPAPSERIGVVVSGASTTAVEFDSAGLGASERSR